MPFTERQLVVSREIDSRRSKFVGAWWSRPDRSGTAEATAAPWRPARSGSAGGVLKIPSRLPSVSETIGEAGVAAFHRRRFRYIELNPAGRSDSTAAR